ncbi:hypothetical protein ACFV0B_20965 [Streptomyces xanthophaeus]
MTDHKERSTPVTAMILLVAPMLLALVLVGRKGGHHARHRASRF